MSTPTLAVDYGLGFDPGTRKFSQLIDGDLVAGATSVDVIDPATGAPFAQAPAAGADQVERAVAAARSASTTWRTTSWEDRSAVLTTVADLIEENAETLARLTTLEQGKPLTEARDDVAWSVAFARHFASVTLSAEVARDDATGYVEVRPEPIGVVAAICPWNFPLFQAVYKMAPALITGNTMVLKTAPTTPVATMYFAELVADAIPAGVFNVIGDAGDVGPLLTAHPGVDKVSLPPRLRSRPQAGSTGTTRFPYTPSNVSISPGRSPENQQVCTA